MNKSLSNSYTNLNASVNDARPRKDSTRLKKQSKATVVLNTSNEINKVPFYPAGSNVKNLKKTIADNIMVPYNNEKATLYSTWTPLSDEKSNQKVNIILQSFE